MSLRNVADCSTSVARRARCPMCIRTAAAVWKPGTANTRPASHPAVRDAGARLSPHALRHPADELELPALALGRDVVAPRGGGKAALARDREPLEWHEPLRLLDPRDDLV